MRDDDKLQETIETNFRLNALYTRQMGQRLDGRIDGLGNRMDGFSSRMDQISHGMEQISQGMSSLARGMGEVATDLKAFGHEIRDDFNTLADRQEATIDVLRKIGSSSVDISKEIADLKRRVSDLEDRDKAS